MGSKRGGATASRGFSVGAFLLGVVLTLAGVFAAGWAYLRYGHPPVAATDAAWPWERQITHIALHAR